MDSTANQVTVSKKKKKKQSENSEMIMRECVVHDAVYAEFATAEKIIGNINIYLRDVNDQDAQILYVLIEPKHLRMMGVDVGDSDTKFIVDLATELRNYPDKVIVEVEPDEVKVDAVVLINAIKGNSEPQAESVEIYDEEEEEAHEEYEEEIVLNHNASKSKTSIKFGKQ
jgi:hypothetical protein